MAECPSESTVVVYWRTGTPAYVLCTAHCVLCIMSHAGIRGFLLTEAMGRPETIPTTALNLVGSGLGPLGDSTSLPNTGDSNNPLAER